MARALLGYVGSSNDQSLVLEVARLRKRVAQLESELASLRESSRAELDIELHHIASEAGAAALT